MIPATRVTINQPITLAEAQRAAIERALVLARGNKTLAARMLQIHRPRLYAMIARHQITLDKFEK